MTTPYAPYPTIKIEDFSPDFVAKTIAALNMIDSIPLGQRLLDDLNTLGQPNPTIDNSRVIIKCPTKDKFVKKHWYSKEKTINTHQKIPLEPHEGGNISIEKSSMAKSNGVGCASVVKFNPWCLVVPGQGPRPVHIALAHELIHSWHYLRGVAKQNGTEEEHFTVGLGTYALPDPNAITENRFRLEFGLPVRLRY